jgi:hypothetical protein
VTSGLCIVNSQSVKTPISGGSAVSTAGKDNGVVEASCQRNEALGFGDRESRGCMHRGITNPVALTG